MILYWRLAHFLFIGSQSPAEHAVTPPPSPQPQPKEAEKNLHTFDVLDFDVFSDQWDMLQESHAKDIVVTWPDGH